MNIYGVIMAGGGGTRFWPLSRQKKPKQLLNLTGKEKMINEAVDRLINVVESDNVFVVTNADQIPQMLETTKGRVIPGHVLAEPVARNTAACIGYAAMEIIKKYGDGVMVITPSDHYIRDVEEFARVLNVAVDVAERKDKLITIGITPTFPATGFGYIKFDKKNDTEAKAVTEYKEKPDEETAKKYISTGDYVWNSGMFVWKASVILQKFEQLIPDIYDDLCKIGEAIGTERELETISTVYPTIRKISVDYAIMEPAASNGDVLVVPGVFGWDDVGSWDMMKVLHEVDNSNNVRVGDTIAIDVRDSVLYSSGKLVAAVGVENLVIVETPDAILVCDKNRAQDVKLVVDELNSLQRKELL